MYWVPIGIPIEKVIQIRSHNKEVIYERKGTLCTKCGRISYTNKKYTTTNLTQQNTPSTMVFISAPKQETWQMVTFPKRKTKNGSFCTIHSRNSKTSPKIYVRAFNAKTGKFYKAHPLSNLIKKISIILLILIIIRASYIKMLNGSKIPP